LTEKLDKLSNDILSLLRNIEPNRLRNHEIVDSLWKSYQSQYKDKKSFGVAVTQKLTLLKANRLIIHEDIWYGTVNSKPIEQQPKESIELIDIRPEWCGVKASPKFCMEHGLPIAKKIIHTKNGKQEKLIFNIKEC